MAINNEYIPDDFTRTRVEDMARAGIPKGLIAEIIEIDTETLDKYYGKEVRHATPKAVARVGATLYQQALNGDTKAMALYLKTQGAKFGWIEKQVIEVATDNQETKELQERVLMLEQKHTKDY